MKDNVVSWRSSVVVSSNKKLYIVHHRCSPDCLPHGTISETMCVSPCPRSYQHRHEFISVWVKGGNTDKLVSLLWKGCWGVSEKATGYWHQVVGIKRSYRSPTMPSGYLFIIVSVEYQKTTKPLSQESESNTEGILSTIRRTASPKEKKPKSIFFLSEFHFIIT